jgi:hypothetical protein
MSAARMFHTFLRRTRRIVADTTVSDRQMIAAMVETVKCAGWARIRFWVLAGLKTWASRP